MPPSAAVGRRLLPFAAVCCRWLPFAAVCRRLLLFAAVCRRLPPSAAVCRRLLLLAAVCRRLLLLAAVRCRSLPLHPAPCTERLAPSVSFSRASLLNICYPPGVRFKLVHAADLHLDSPLVGLARYEGAPVSEVRGATRRALENLVNLCLEEDAKLLLLAGDLYDGDWRDYATGLFFAAQMARLRETGTQVVWIRGNHDAESKITRHLSLGEHCHELSTKKPQTIAFEALSIAVHGQGFFTPAVQEDLSAGYPEPMRGALNIGLLHTALSGRPGHAPYAPCDVRALAARGYDYWALGHVHQREVVQDEPYIVFPGNLQARHVRETGAKGATLIHVEDGRIAKVEARALDVVRFDQLRVDVSYAEGQDDVARSVKEAVRTALAAAEGRLLALRVHVLGKTRAHGELVRDFDRARAQIQSSLNEIQGGDVWLEDVRFATEAQLDRGELAQREDVLGELLRSLEGMADDEELVREVSRELGELYRLLPAELRAQELDLDPTDLAQVRALLGSVKSQLLPRLLGL
jgi:DNA repair exonuclease SbcCD nuclease subunit